MEDCKPQKFIDCLSLKRSNLSNNDKYTILCTIFSLALYYKRQLSKNDLLDKKYNELKEQVSHMKLNFRKDWSKIDLSRITKKDLKNLARVELECIKSIFAQIEKYNAKLGRNLTPKVVRYAKRNKLQLATIFESINKDTFLADHEKAQIEYRFDVERNDFMAMTRVHSHLSVANAELNRNAVTWSVQVSV